MSTRSRIGLLQADGTVKSIYCHFDGYPDSVGADLVNHYYTREKIEKLLELGDISSLGTFYDEELAKETWKNQFDSKWLESENGKRARKLTLPYKDRGEENVEARIDATVEEFLGNAGSCGEEYVYLFRPHYDGTEKWYGMEVPYLRPVDEMNMEKENV